MCYKCTGHQAGDVLLSLVDPVVCDILNGVPSLLLFGTVGFDRRFFVTL